MEILYNNVGVWAFYVMYKLMFLNIMLMLYFLV